MKAIPGKTPRRSSKELSREYHRNYRSNLKKTDPLAYKSHQLRSNWKQRAKKYGLDVSFKSSEIKAWLESKRPFKCYYTGEPIGDNDIGIDHKTPISRGGTFDFDNLVVTSKYVNGAKGEMTDEEFWELLNVIVKWKDKGKSLLMRLRVSGSMYKGKTK